VDEDQVLLEVKDAVSSSLMRPTADPANLYVIMPLRV